jgi:hypothetical protein
LKLFIFSIPSFIGLLPSPYLKRGKQHKYDDKDSCCWIVKLPRIQNLTPSQAETISNFHNFDNIITRLRQGIAWLMGKQDSRDNMIINKTAFELELHTTAIIEPTVSGACQNCGEIEHYFETPQKVKCTRCYPYQ